METLGERIKFIRKNFKLTQKEFADKLYVSSSYISKVEKNIEIPTDMFLKLLSYEFDESFDFLKTGTQIQHLKKKDFNNLDYYNEINKKMNRLFKDSKEENKLYITDTYNNFVNLITGFGLDDKTKEHYYEILSYFFHSLENLQLLTRDIAKNNKNDYKSLFFYKDYLEMKLPQLNLSLKEIIEIYIK